MNIKYVAFALIRRHIPENILFAIMKRRGVGNSAEQDPDQYFSDWSAQLAQHSLSLSGKQVLELGSGRYARFALRMIAAGARKVRLVDLYAVALNDSAHREMLEADCQALGLDFTDAMERIEVCQGDFLALPDPLPENQVDFVTSSAVLEHVRDPRMILAGCFRWLKPGGVAYHVIDLRDHNLSFQYPFEMLTFSDANWDRWIDLQGGFHLNRWRASDYLDAMQAAGFVDMQHKAYQRDLQGLKMIKPRLNQRYRLLSEDMLSILGLTVFGRKPSV